MNVVSYSFFRHPNSRFEKPEAGAYRGQFFAAHLPLVLRAAAANFPGWQVRIHHDESLWEHEYSGALVGLEHRGLVQLVSMGKADTLCGAMLWRMMPAWDETVTRFIARDLDSVPSPRERRVVQEWCDSGLPFHAIHDHAGHVGTPLMGGMIGIKPRDWRQKTKLKSLGDLLGHAGRLGIDLNQHGADQRLLNSVCWGALRGSTMMHQLKSDRDEEAASTVFKVPLTSPEPWMGAKNGLSIFKGPHIGAVFTEYDGETYHGPTYEKRTVSSRLARGLEFYGGDWDGYAIREIEKAEELAGVAPDALIAGASPKRYVLFASDMNETYAFFLPITARMWREVTGLTPIAILVGTPEQWSIGRLAIAKQELLAVGARVFHVPMLEGHRDSTVAQVSRLYAGCLPLADEDYVLTSDVDMWPMGNREYFKVDPKAPLHILYANAYTRQERGRTVPDNKYPICYVGAKVREWRQIMRVSPGTLEESLRRQLDDGLGRGADPSAAWNYDELLLGLRIGESGLLPRAQLKNRNTSRDRIDRSAWPADPNIAAAVDSHVLRPGDTDENWERLLPLIRTQCGSGAWANSYRMAFIGRNSRVGLKD